MHRCSVSWLAAVIVQVLHDGAVDDQREHLQEVMDSRNLPDVNRMAKWRRDHAGKEKQGLKPRALVAVYGVCEDEKPYEPRETEQMYPPVVATMPGAQERDDQA